MQPLLFGDILLSNTCNACLQLQVLCNYCSNINIPCQWCFLFCTKSYIFFFFSLRLVSQKILYHKPHIVCQSTNHAFYRMTLFSFHGLCHVLVYDRQINFLLYYHLLFHLYDEQTHSHIGVFPYAFLLLICVPSKDHHEETWDVQVLSPTHNHLLFQLFLRPIAM